MKGEKFIVLVTALMAFAAGFCDTTTYIVADHVFSAHVTGNFIVLAYDLVNHADSGTWIKLLTFPVFIVAVIIGGWIAGIYTRTYTIVIIEGVMLILAGIAAAIIRQFSMLALSYIPLMLIVFAMGLQNAFGKLFPKATIGPTTMMTGNVTQIALDIGSLAKKRLADLTIAFNLKRQLINIAAFLGGCIAGGMSAKLVGLSAVVFPGIILTYFSLSANFRENISY